MGLIDKALCIAQKAHANQTDKAGEVYINHPKYVASVVETEYEKATALLHDVLEDSAYTVQDLINEGIPQTVINSVLILTKDKTTSYESYLHNVRANPIARKVKLADLRHNLDISRIPNPSEEDYKRIKKYKKAFEYLS